METIEVARQFLEQQSNVAVWYVEYEGRDEIIRFANEYFSDIFAIPVEKILEKKRYHLVNPPDTPEDIIEQYKDEDLAAIHDGVFISRGPFEPGKDIEVVKLRFDRGVLGLFQVVDSVPDSEKITLRNLDVEILGVVRRMRPDLFE